MALFSRRPKKPAEQSTPSPEPSPADATTAGATPPPTAPVVSEATPAARPRAEPRGCARRRCRRRACADPSEHGCRGVGVVHLGLVVRRARCAPHRAPAPAAGPEGTAQGDAADAGRASPATRNARVDAHGARADRDGAGAARQRAAAGGARPRRRCAGLAGAAGRRAAAAAGSCVPAGQGRRPHPPRRGQGAAARGRQRRRAHVRARVLERSGAAGEPEGRRRHRHVGDGPAGAHGAAARAREARTTGSSSTRRRRRRARCCPRSCCSAPSIKPTRSSPSRRCSPPSARPRSAPKVAEALTRVPLWVAVGTAENGAPGLAEGRDAEGARYLEVYSHPLEVAVMGRGDNAAPITAAQLVARAAQPTRRSPASSSTPRGRGSVSPATTSPVISLTD